MSKDLEQSTRRLERFMLAFAAWTVAWLLIGVPLRLLLLLVERLGVPLRFDLDTPWNVLLPTAIVFGILGLQLLATVSLYRTFRSDDR